jgi:hypothetical protein
VSFASPTDVAALASGDHQAALDVVTALMRSYCRQTLTAVADDAVILAGTQSRRLFLGERPVTAVDSPITLDGVALADIEWRWNRRGVLWRQEGWGDDVTPVQVTYDHGFATVPADLAAVCRTASVRLGDNPAAMQAFTIVGDFSKTFGASSEFFGFTVAEQTVLDRYRRRVWP